MFTSSYPESHFRPPDTAFSLSLPFSCRSHTTLMEEDFYIQTTWHLTVSDFQEVYSGVSNSDGYAVVTRLQQESVPLPQRHFCPVTAAITAAIV